MNIDSIKEKFEDRKDRYPGLTLVLAFIVFIVISITMLIMSGIIISLINLDLIATIPLRNPIVHIGFIAILSIVIATVLTLILGHIPLKPLNLVINATNELAKGNFDTRINLTSLVELKELSTSFNKMAEELGNTEMLRNDFINNFSHEFKTPIVSLKGFAKLLKSDNLTKEERDEYLDIIIAESTRLSSLATNVLNLSKIEHQKIVTEMNDFDLTESIRHCILLLENQWHKKSLNLDINLEEITYFANEELLNQVWLNLIDNAIKFSNINGTLEISLMKSKDSIYFKIKDNGCGMSIETQNKIFDKFYQGDYSHSTPGNGLGLPIIKKIIELHNGSIHVTSEANVGSIFTIEIPLYID